MDRQSSEYADASNVSCGQARGIFVASVNPLLQQTPVINTAQCWKEIAYGNDHVETTSDSFHLSADAYLTENLTALPFTAPSAVPSGVWTTSSC